MRQLYLAATTALLFVGAVVACSSSATGITGTDAGSDDDGTPTTPTPAPVVPVDAAVATPQPVIYAHSPTTLYRFDTTTNALTKIADFSGCSTDVTDSVIDLAVATDGTAYLSTFKNFAKVSLATGVCTSVVTNAGNASSLAFVPNDAGGQQLVAYSGSEYDAIDPATGNRTPLGLLGGGYEASGDIATFDGGTFLSAVGRECADCLFQVDPRTGVRLRSFGDIGTDFVYGLAGSTSALYAFSGNGIVVRAVPLADGGIATAIVFDAGTPIFFGAATGPAQ